MLIQGAEKRQCPPEFQDRLTRLFGRNKYGDPLYKIVWGQSEFHRMGNVWRDKAGNERKGYRLRYLCHGQPCWNILRWEPPKKWLSPAAFYQNTFDDLSGLYIMGEYPWRGRYVVVTPLMRKEMVGNRLVIHYFPLTGILVDKVIANLRNDATLSAEQRKALNDAAKALEHKKEVESIAEMMAHNMPAYWGAVSFTGQGMHTSLLNRKMEAIQKQWNRIFSRGKSKAVFRKGFSVGGNKPKRFFM